jgi:hypothetical protein
VLSKQRRDGCWKQEDDYFKGGMLVRFEKTGKPSKWVTREALKVLTF